MTTDLAGHTSDVASVEITAPAVVDVVARRRDGEAGSPKAPCAHPYSAQSKTALHHIRFFGFRGESSRLRPTFNDLRRAFGNRNTDQLILNTAEFARGMGYGRGRIPLHVAVARMIQKMDKYDREEFVQGIPLSLVRIATRDAGDPDEERESTHGR